MTSAAQRVCVRRQGRQTWMSLAEYLRTLDDGRLDPLNPRDGRATQFRLYEVEAVDPNPFDADVGDALMAAQCIVTRRADLGSVLFVPEGGLAVRMVVDTQPFQRVEA